MQGNILDKILEYKHRLLDEEKLDIPLNKMIEIAEKVTGTRSFYRALDKCGSISIIAEVKKASPSKGVIKEDFDPVETAIAYEKNGVNAISVLTEDRFFQGNKSYLKNIRKRVNVPLLRKDFIFDPYQVYQSKALGADAILLITRILSDAVLKQLINLTHELGMDALVEVHSEEEIEKALNAGAKIIGINNRDLTTFKTNLSVTESLIKHIPEGILTVSESGIKTFEDMKFLKALGVNAVLIGEAFMRADSISEKINELTGSDALD